MVRNGIRGEKGRGGEKGEGREGKGRGERGKGGEREGGEGERSGVGRILTHQQCLSDAQCLLVVKLYGITVAIGNLVAI